MQPAQTPFAGHDPQLGGVVSRWKAGWTQRIALFVISWIFAGIVVLIGASTENVRLVLLGVVIGCGLVGLIEYFQSGVEVVVYTNGIERRGRTGKKRIAWSALASYRLNMIDPMVVAGATGGLIGALIVRAVLRIRGNDKAVTPRAVIIRDTQGTQVIVPDGLAGYKELIATLVPSLTDRLFPAAKRAFDSNQSVSFGDALVIQRNVGVTVKGLFGKKTTLPMADFSGATVDRARLLIHKKGKRGWHALGIPSVENLGVFERLVVGTPGEPIDSDGLPMAWTS
jgi:hypothetical protein